MSSYSMIDDILKANSKQPESSQSPSGFTPVEIRFDDYTMTTTTVLTILPAPNWLYASGCQVCRLPRLSRHRYLSLRRGACDSFQTWLPPTQGRVGSGVPGSGRVNCQTFGSTGTGPVGRINRSIFLQPRDNGMMHSANKPDIHW